MFVNSYLSIIKYYLKSNHTIRELRSHQDSRKVLPVKKIDNHHYFLNVHHGKLVCMWCECKTHVY